MLLVIGGVFNSLLAVPFLVYLLWRGGDIFNLPLIINGILFTLACWLYFHALKIGETVSVAPWYQTIPVFGLVGSFIFLNEIPTVFQIAGIFLVMLGGFAITSSKKMVINKKIIFLMLLSSLLLTINDVTFAYFGREISLSSALFSDILGKAVWGIPFLLMGHIRQSFVLAIKNKLSVQSINEIIFIIGDAIFDIAKIYLPVALVQATANTQPLFVLLLSLILYKIAPKYLQEEKESLHKLRVVGIFAVVLGGVLLVF
jgi:drug/metabolite transporter (DMT)-like permease